MKFLFIVLLVWGGMHAYVWAHVRTHAALQTRWALLLGGGMLLLMAAPFLGMILTRTGHPAVGRPVEIAGMVWAGVFFLLFSLSLIHGVYNGVVAVAGLLAPAVRAARLSGPRVLTGELALVALVSGYSVFEARHIVVEHVRIETKKLPADLERVRIVQICDVHLGTIVGRRRLGRIVELVRQAGPDLLVSTGDLVDADMGDCVELADMLASLRAPLGKYAVTGNHEYYAGLAESVAFTRRAGFTLLSNEAARVCEGLSLAGVDDETARRWHSSEGAPWDEQKVLDRTADGDYVVLLKHRPLVEPDSVPLMDLQLSGHTHRGQIFPFTLLVAAYYEYGHGLVELAPQKHLYTSRGTGTWGPPMRFLNPPEITIIDIVSAATSSGLASRTCLSQMDNAEITVPQVGSSDLSRTDYGG